VESSLERSFPPHCRCGIIAEILNDNDPSITDGSAGRAAARIAVGPTQVHLFEKASVSPSAGNRPNRLGRVILSISHPRHAVSGLVADDPANLVQQGLFVFGSQQGLVAHADGTHFPIQLPLPRFAFAFLHRGVADGLHDGND
jgi:hypothetical protein